MATMIVRSCSMCSSQEEVGNKNFKELYKACGVCKGAYYCCVAHQRAHWKEHRQVCAAPGADIKGDAALEAAFNTIFTRITAGEAGLCQQLHNEAQQQPGVVCIELSSTGEKCGFIALSEVLKNRNVDTGYLKNFDYNIATCVWVQYRLSNGRMVNKIVFIKRDACFQPQSVQEEPQVTLIADKRGTIPELTPAEQGRQQLKIIKRQIRNLGGLADPSMDLMQRLAGTDGAPFTEIKCKNGTFFALLNEGTLPP